MNITVIIIQLVALAVLFSLCIGIPMTKNPEAFVDNYPPEIRDEYLRTHPRSQEQLTRGAIMRKGVFLVVAAFVLAWMASLAGATTFLEGSLVSFLYIAWVGAFDTFVLDWVFFPRVRRWRLPGTEHMDREYRQKWFHLKGVLQVLPLGIAYALLCGLIVIWLF